MSVLGELQPNKVFKYFEEICSIPHGSRNLQQISDYLVDFAKAHELKYRQDEDLNVIIWKDATPGYEQAPTVILQGHMDMVAVKTWLQSKKQIAIKIWKKKDWIWKSMEIIFQQKELL